MAELKGSKSTCLKPCPFCGSKGTAYKDDFGKIIISCDNCGAMVGVSLECGVELVNGWTALFDTIEEATAAWNQRTEQAGRWIHDINNLYACSECRGRETMSPHKMKEFCPNCGAKMDGKEQD